MSSGIRPPRIDRSDAKVRRDEAASRVEQGTTRRRRVGSPWPLVREAFSFLEADLDTYDPHSDRGEVAAGLGGRAGLPRRRTPRRAPSRTNQLVPARDAALPVGRRCTWGTSSTTRWATSSRTSGAATAGTCCARWAGTRSACRPRTRRSARAATRARSSSATSTTSREQMKRLGWAIDWDREVAAHEPGLLPLDAVAVPALLRARARLPQGGAGQLVPARPDGARERAGRSTAAASAAAPRSSSRKLEQWFFRITAYADALLRRPTRLIDWPERTKTIQRNWIGRSRGRRDAVPRSTSSTWTSPVFTTRPDTLFGATFFVLAPEHPLVDELIDARRTATSCGEYVAPRDGQRVEDARRPRTKTGVFTGFYAINPATDERDPDLGRRLRADGLRHRRDHGRARARRARPRVRRALRPAGRARSIDEETGTLVDSGAVQRHARRGGEAGDRRVARASAAAARPAVSFRAARLGLLAAALLGRADPDRLLRRLRHRPRPGRRAAGAAARGRGLPPEGQAAAGLERGVAERRRARRAAGRRSARPTRWTPSSTRRGTSSATVDPHNDARRRSSRRLVDYWVPVDQYIGGIDHATGHLLYSRFFVKVLNEHGAGRLPRAVRSGCSTRAGCARAGRRCRSRRATSTAPDQLADTYGADAVRLYILFVGPRRPGHGLDRGGDRGHRRASCAGCGGSCTRPRRGAGATARRRAAGAQGARDDREGDRRHRPPVQSSTRRSRR